MKLKPNIPKSLVTKVNYWLGDDGISFFKELKEKYNDISPVIGGSIPHPVHLREGMQVRNFMRGCDECIGWTDHDFDDNWGDVVEQAIENKEN